MEIVRTVLHRQILRTSPALNLWLRELVFPIDTLATEVARVVSISVTDDFMTAVVPLATIHVGVAYGRHLMLLFCLCLLAANWTKNILRLPRPTGSDGCLLSQEEKSFGMPSLHCCAAVAVPLFVATNSPIPYAVSIAWSCCIGLARLHLGVHSLPDVVMGWALGAAIFLCFHSASASGRLDAAMGDMRAGPFLIPAACILALFHPCGRLLDIPKRPGLVDDTVKESVIIIGCAMGVLLNAWRAANYPAAAPPTIEIIAHMPGAAGVVARSAVALACTGLTKLATAPLAKHLVDLVAFACGYSKPTSAERAKGLCDGTTMRERCTRLLQYTCVGYVVFDTAPALCGIYS